MKDLRWKTIASEYLHNEQWLTVRKDTCERPDGRIISPYYVMEYDTWVTALALTEDGKVVMEKQYRHALGTVAWEIPGGCVDATDASLDEAIARELLEETGYAFSKYEYLGKTSSNPSTNSNWMHMYLATGGKKVQDQNLDENEEIIVELFSIEELKDMLNKGEIIQSMHVTTIFYALQKLGKL
ncbi:MAG: NUDIX hydrolase [Candidatus Pseudobacter hemicellulosilyticus]|uniref:NUDIX hydrolase n=1 Tax=Candidatus Pseudobacter hemicellulosilyticus TaxID=3121375 RepID=A0AAJ5WUS6_9BACT|nr:MAG: NUDIX hydrolase [Pseudobacter sp.]